MNLGQHLHVHLPGGIPVGRVEGDVGLNDTDSRIFVRPHLGLPDGQTPGEAAGIHVEGEDGWLTIILAAAKSKAKTESAAGA